jgi:hypothetical protein
MTRYEMVLFAVWTLGVALAAYRAGRERRS